MTSSAFTMKPIGYLSSPFKEKFGIPRQPGMIDSVTAFIEFHSPYNESAAFNGLEDFSHIWLTFCFHKNDHSQWRPLIRPPRLGGNQKIGVFASRSSFRPNGLGQSLVQLIKVHSDKGKTRLEIACPDILDGTPILDIRPYIAYSEAIPDARCGFADSRPNPTLTVEFTPQSEKDLAQFQDKTYRDLKRLIREVLSYDPRPAYKTQNDSRQYGIKLYDLNILWQVNGNSVSVLAINKIPLSVQ